MIRIYMWDLKAAYERRSGKTSEQTENVERNRSTYGRDLQFAFQCIKGHFNLDCAATQRH